MADSPQMTKKIQDVQTNPLEAIKALVDIIQSVPQQIQAGNDLNAQSNIQNQNSVSQNAYQKGVDSYRKEAGYTDAQQYHAAGGDLNAMDSHPAMKPASNVVGDTQSNNITPQHIATIAAMLNAAQESNAPPVQQNASQQNVNAIGQAAANAVLPQNGIHPLGALLNLVGNITGVNQLNTLQGLAQQKMLGMAQRTAAGQPGEVALPQAQAGLAGTESAVKQAELNAGTPAANVALTKQQTEASKQEILNKKSEIKAGIYKAQSERDIQTVKNLQDRRAQVLTQMKDDLEKGPITNRGPRLDNYRRQLDYYDKQLQKLTGSITQPGNSGYLKTGTLPDGRRIGQKADGTTEIING